MLFPEWIKIDLPLGKAIYGIMKINISVADKQSPLTE
jgi:predicted cation transporter